MKIKNYYSIEDKTGASIFLDQEELNELSLALGGWTITPRPWTKEEIAALDKPVQTNAEVELSTEESPDGCAKDDYCTCAVCLRNHI